MKLVCRKSFLVIQISSSLAALRFSKKITNWHPMMKTVSIRTTASTQVLVVWISKKSRAPCMHAEYVFWVQPLWHLEWDQHLVFLQVTFSFNGLPCSLWSFSSFDWEGIPEPSTVIHKSNVKVVAANKRSSSPMGHPPFFFLSVTCQNRASHLHYHCDDHRSSLFFFFGLPSSAITFTKSNRLRSSRACMKSVWSVASSWGTMFIIYVQCRYKSPCIRSGLSTKKTRMRRWSRATGNCLNHRFASQLEYHVAYLIVRWRHFSSPSFSISIHC